MPVHHAIWRVGENPQPLIISKLASEQLLERMILTDPTILSDQWMIIGHQDVNRMILSDFLFRRAEDVPYIFIPQDKYFHIVSTQTKKLFELRKF